MTKRFMSAALLLLLWPLWATAGVDGLINIPRQYHIFKPYFKTNPETLKLALEAYDCAVISGESDKQAILTIVDYSRPSNLKRLWVLNLNTGKVLYHTYVAHGVGSGKLDPNYFSNLPHSLASSIGLYETGKKYYGHWGYAMRLYGLDRGFNNNAFRRHIVFHGGRYVSHHSIQEYGMIGMSHGCFVVPVTVDQQMIDTLKGGSLLFVYYPNQHWLSHSKYLHCSVLGRMNTLS